MIDVVLYFQVHQPYRLRPWLPKDRITRTDYFDHGLDRLVLDRVVERCYLPMNRLLLEAIDRSDGEFRCAFSLSGTVLQQLRDWAPQALDSFVALADTGNVEFLCETSHHSLAAVADADEFVAQVGIQRDVVEDLFGTPTTFRNTELILDNTICAAVEGLGFDAMLGEGVDRLLGWRSPQVPYRPKGCRRLKLLLRSYSLSDDISFRFSNRLWPSFPLFADTYAGWLHAAPPPAQFLGLFMDYETFGEHQAAATGIFEFMRHLPEQVLQEPGFRFRTPAQVAAEREAAFELDVPTPVSWADAERDLGAWLGNPMQQAAQQAIYALRADVLATGDAGLIAAWRKLTTSDHVYYAGTPRHGDGEVHAYFSPHRSPHAAFVALMTALDDLRQKVERRRARQQGQPQQQQQPTRGAARAASNQETIRQ